MSNWTKEEIMAYADGQLDESSIKRPDHCGLYIVIPNAVEFWQERDNRTHERLKYFLSDDQKWSSHLLSP